MNSNLKSVAVTVLELLAFNDQKFMGHMTMPTLPFWKILKQSHPNCPQENARQIWSRKL